MSFQGIKAYSTVATPWAAQAVNALPLDAIEFASTGYGLTGGRVIVPTAGIYRCRVNTFIHGQVYSDAPLYILKNAPAGPGSPSSFPPGGVAAIIRGGQQTPYTAQPYAVGGVGMAVAEAQCVVGDTLSPWLYIDDAGQGHGPFSVGHASQYGLQTTFMVEYLGGV